MAWIKQASVLVASVLMASAVKADEARANRPVTFVLPEPVVAEEADEEAGGVLVEAYRRPVPQLAAGAALAPHAHAMMDVSDGLLLDAQRLADASGMGMALDLEALPLSDAFVAERGADREARLFAATGGDDYALLAAIPPEAEEAVRTCLPSRTIMAAIGRVEDGAGLRLFDALEPIELPERLGHEHRPQ